MLPPADSVTQHVVVIRFKPSSDRNSVRARRPPHVPDLIALWSEEVSNVFTPINAFFPRLDTDSTLSRYSTQQRPVRLVF